MKFKLNGKRVVPNHAVKYLGMLLDEHLQWKKMTTPIKIKLNCVTDIRIKIRNTPMEISKNSKNDILFSLVPIFSM